MEADRLGSRRFPEHVVLEDPDAAIPHELGCQTPDPLREHLCRDHGVGLPRVAELACPILGVAPRHPVHLVRANARLVLACKEGLVALAQQLEYPLGNETLIEDEEAVAVKALDLLGSERVDELRDCHERQALGRILSGS